MSKIIYLKTNRERQFAVKIETNFFGKLKSWSIRNLNSKNENFHRGHSNIKSVNKFKNTKLVSIVQGTSLFTELYGKAANVNDIDTSEIVEEISGSIK